MANVKVTIKGTEPFSAYKADDTPSMPREVATILKWAALLDFATCTGPARPAGYQLILDGKSRVKFGQMNLPSLAQAKKYLGGVAKN